MFKEYVEQDIEQVFVDFDEFADQIYINGVSVNVIEDHDKLMYRIKKNFDGLTIGDVLFYISDKELKKITNGLSWKSGTSIKYKGKHAIITTITDQKGIWEVILEGGV